MNQNSYITGSLFYVEFTKGNGIGFYQDFGWKKELPDDIKFFPIKSNDTDIKFIGDEYGIIPNNILRLEGKYGNGAIYIEKKDLPEELLELCLNNLPVYTENIERS